MRNDVFKWRKKKIIYTYMEHTFILIQRVKKVETSTNKVGWLNKRIKKKKK